MGVRVGKRDEGRGTRRREEGRGGRKRVRFFLFPPFFRVSSLSSLLALSSLPSVAPRSRRKGGRDEQWKQHRGRRRRPAATATTTATARGRHGERPGSPCPSPGRERPPPAQKLETTKHHFLLLDLLVERGLAVRGEARAGQGDVGGLGELGHVGELGLDLRRGRERVEEERERVSGGRERVEPRKASVCFF